MSSQTIPTDADYVIVGGGTAGLVLASRLSEDPSKTIVVLEAGTDLTQDPRTQIPALWTSLMGSEVDWQLTTTPQRTLGNRVIKQPQGKLLGGSSGINGQAFIAPSKAVIDSWSKLGATGWTWDQLHPYYKKSYTLQLPDAATREHLGLGWVDADSHGSSGPLKVSFPAVIQDPLSKAWVESFRGIGYGVSADPFSGQSTGGFSTTATLDAETKTRSWAATAYGLPAAQRPGVTIVTEANVQKVLFSAPAESGVTATGVQVIVKGQSYEIKAKTEVIVTAGALNTPKLLELSGIGNEEILRQFNIPVVVASRGVGENLQDHLMSGLSLEVVDEVHTGDALMRQEPDALQAAMQLYTEYKAGPLAAGGVQSGTFMPLREFQGPSVQHGIKEHLDSFVGDTGNTTGRDQAIREILTQANSPTSFNVMFLAQVNLHETGKSFVGQDLLPGKFVSLGIIHSLPFSRGNVHITSGNQADLQAIDPQYFSNPLDLDIMARGLLDLEQLHKAQPLAQFFKPQGQRNHPDAFLTDLESAKRYLRDTATTTYHPCGTAAMLPRESGGVVDEQLRVHGTTNLRVCDASIFPLIPPGNIMSTVYAVAERAADIIKSSE